MPCICYGAVSGDEAFDNFRKDHPKEYEEIMKCLALAEYLIRIGPRDPECMVRDWQDKWVKCFEHRVKGCPELEAK